MALLLAFGVQGSHARGEDLFADYFSDHSAGLAEVVSCGYQPQLETIPTELPYVHLRLEDHSSSLGDSNWPIEQDVVPCSYAAMDHQHSTYHGEAYHHGHCRHRHCGWHTKSVWSIGKLCTPDSACRQDCYRRLLDRPLFRPAWCFFGDVARDYRYFYSWPFTKAIAAGLGVHAILSNTSLDEDIRGSVQASARGAEDAFSFGRYMGDHAYIVPGIAVIWGLDVLQRRILHRQLWHPVVGDWAYQSMRAYAVGAPATGLLQLLVGASRPGESTAESRWKPYSDDNGVSGHAFVGAIPFIVAAKRCDSLLMKSAFYFGSTLTAYSRVYDDKHYMSQAIMGWWVAYLAVEATECTNRSCRNYRMIPAAVNGWPGMALEYRF